MPDRMPEDMSDRMPEDMPDRMPEDMPDRMPNRMSEDMSDRMPEDVPVRTYINVMVGITRSNVFFQKKIKLHMFMCIHCVIISWVNGCRLYPEPSNLVPLCSNLVGGFKHFFIFHNIWE